MRRARCSGGALWIWPCMDARQADTMKAAAGDDVGQAAGVLSNDWSASWPGLSAVLNGGPSYGTLTLNSDGSFTYTPTNWGTECFTYEATDGVNNFGTATVTVLVAPTSNCLFSDDFRRCTGTALTPWQVAPDPSGGQWSLGGGTMQGSSSLESYGSLSNQHLGRLLCPGEHQPSSNAVGRRRGWALEFPPAEHTTPPGFTRKAH